MRFGRLSALIAVVVALVLTTGSAAFAHVTPDPASAPKGAGDQEITFRVPNEEPNANTVSLTLQLPQDHPIAAVAAADMPGWTSTVTTRHLDTPLKTDDGSFSDVASVITWTGGTITPGHYGDFRILAMGLPADTDSLTFKAIQGYSDGKTASWIDTGADAQFPAPVVKLAAADAAAADHHAATPTATAKAAPATTSSTSDSSGNALGITGIVVGGVALAAAIVAIVLSRRREPTSS